jgi:acyl carrier protein phosphodiesterase
MNFLAHFYLTYPYAELTAGNFLGDFVKGKKYQNYPPVIARGILLHREIDHFTDHNSLHIRSKRRLGKQYGHFTGIIIDMFYDHLLAVNWQKYADEPLQMFSARVYEMLERRSSTFPDTALRVLHYMATHDWLSGYRQLEGLETALKGISRRSKFPVELEEAILDLERYFSLFEEDFDTFFPQLISHTHNHLKFLP